MAFSGAENRRRLVWSMAVLAAIVIGVGLATSAITGYFRSQDPIYQCIQDPELQPFQVSVPVEVTEDGVRSLVPAGIGISDGCVLPVHTLEEGVIHVAYHREHPFTLGHFLYNWKIDLTKFDTEVYVNDQLHAGGSFLDIVLKQGDSIRIEFTKKG